jgi:ferredoxin
VTATIRVREDLCIGGGQCVFAAPDLFAQRDEDGVVVLLAERPAPEQVSAARRAAALCPVSAISVTDV